MLKWFSTIFSLGAPDELACFYGIAYGILIKITHK